MSDSAVALKIAEGVARLTLCRAQKRNALTREMLAEFRDRLQELASNSAVRLFVVAAEGPVFCAGMDLAQMEETATLPNASELWQHDSEIYRDVVAAIFSLHIPTLAVVQGPAVAGGLGLVLACDMVLASDAATFSLPEPKRGIVAGLVTPLLMHRVGAGVAGWVLLSGQSTTADNALRWGICHRVVPADQLDWATTELVKSILTGSPAALAATKDQLRNCSPVDVLAHLQDSPNISARARETEDAREGLRAFLEKRPPFWSSKD